MTNQYVYPLFMLHRRNDLIVMFTERTVGEVIQQGTYAYVNGHISKTWAPHDDSKIWEHCADPRQSQRVNKMLKALKDV